MVQKFIFSIIKLKICLAEIFKGDFYRFISSILKSFLGSAAALNPKKVKLVFKSDFFLSTDLLYS